MNLATKAARDRTKIPLELESCEGVRAQTEEPAVTTHWGRN